MSRKRARIRDGQALSKSRPTSRYADKGRMQGGAKNERAREKKDLTRSEWEKEGWAQPVRVLHQIEKDPRILKEFRWPAPLQSDPRRRDLSNFCAYHKEHGHDTNHCRNLIREIGRLKYEGKIPERVFIEEEAPRRNREVPRERERSPQRLVQNRQDRPRPQNRDEEPAPQQHQDLANPPVRGMSARPMRS